MATSFRLDEREQAKGFASYLAQLERRIADLERANPLTNAALDGGAIEVYDDEGSLQVVVGEQGDGTTGVIHFNGDPPPTPTVPVLAEALGGPAATWDGQFTDAMSAPLDFSRIEVHTSTTAEFEPTQATQVGTIESPRGGVFLIPAETPVYVRLLARNLSGTAGEPSATAGPVGPAKVVAQDVLDGIISEIKIANEAISAAKLQLGAVGTGQLAVNSVTSEKIVGLSITAEKLAALSVTADKLAALSVTADKIAANAVTAAHILAGSIDSTHLKAGSITADKLDANAINGKVITGATVQTGTSGARLVLDQKLRMYDANNVLAAEATMSGGQIQDVGFIAYNVSGLGRYYAMLSRGFILFGKEGVSYRQPPSIDHQLPGGGVSVLRLNSGSISTDSGIWAELSLAGGPQDGSQPPHVDIFSNAMNGGLCDLSVTGAVRAGNMVTGTATITPVPNVPTPVTITGLNVAGKAPFRALATAISKVPGTTVTGVSVTAASATGLTVWVTRTNDTPTDINWMVVGA